MSVTRRGFFKRAAVAIGTTAVAPAQPGVCKEVRVSHGDFGRVDGMFTMRPASELRRNPGLLHGYYRANKDLVIFTKHCAGAAYLFASCMAEDDLESYMLEFLRDRKQFYRNKYRRGKGYAMFRKTAYCQESTVRLYFVRKHMIFGKWASVQWFPNVTKTMDHGFLFEMGHPGTKPIFTLSSNWIEPPQ